MSRHFKIKKQLGTELEPQEIILDRMIQSREKEKHNPASKLERPIKKRGIKIWAWLFLLIWLVFIGKVGYLQIARGQYYRQLSEKNQFLVQTIQAERGVIYDSHLHQLVQNAASFDLVLEKQKFFLNPEKEEVLKELAGLLHQDQNVLQKIIEESSQEKIILKKNLDHHALLLLISKTDQWSGISIRKQSTRKYLTGEVLAHILGFVSRSDQQGESGLEKEYEEILKANLGSLQITKDSLGKQISAQVLQTPSPGQSLILNIDLPLQQKIDEVLRKRMQEVNSPEANAIAIDPNNGHILAIVSLPSYDDNIFSAPLSRETLKQLESQKDFSLFNSAISGIGYPTGSVIKPLIGLAALEEKIIDTQTQLPCPEKICVLNKYTQEETCYHDWKYHGPSDLRRALAESVNTYFYVVGGGTSNFQGLGPQKIKDWLSKFRWGKYTGIDIPQEGKGILPIIDQNWHLGDTYHLSIGQGYFSATPLQVATAYSAIANGGKIYQPQIVHAIIQEEEPSFKTIQEMTPVVLSSNLGNPQNLEVIKEGMRQAVTSRHGSSHLLNGLSESVASKTGTAQTGIENNYHNWIAVFGPYEKPNIVLVLMLKNVPDNMVALTPAAKEILSWYFSQQNDKLE